MKINVALIGLGNISLLFDDKIDTNTILSHVKALYKDNRFDLKYCVDINSDNESKLREFFSEVIFYTDTTELLKQTDIDIVVIATPTSTHFNILNKLQNHPSVKFFLVEKPLFDTNHSLDSIDKKIANKLIINYIRIFEPHLQEFKNQIQNKQFGTTQKIVLTYTKGAKNNGSHFITLLNFLFLNSEITNIKILSTQDGLENDPTLDIIACMNYEGKQIPLYLIGLNHNKYSVFDIDFYFDNGKVRIEDTEQTMMISQAIEDKTYSSYITLKKSNNIKLDFDKVMKYPYEYIYNIMNNNISKIDFVAYEKKNMLFFNKLEQKEFLHG